MKSTSRGAIFVCMVTLLLVAACARLKQSAPLEAPAEEARHRAALATIIVSNATTSELRIAFRTTPAPVQEVVIGTVAPAQRQRLAPVPAGEPIILIARKSDGSELLLEARSFPLDAEWLWEIPREATFTIPGK